MKNYDYYGVFLDDDDKDLLLYGANVPKDWRIYCDHCTLIHHSCENQTIVPFLDAFLGTRVRFFIVAIGKSENAIAYKVSLPSMNETAHITVAVAPGHKPVESNDIKNWDFRNIPDRWFTGTLGVHFLSQNK